MTITNERLEQLLSECINYIDELKENDEEVEKDCFWKNVIGMTNEELAYFSL